MAVPIEPPEWLTTIWAGLGGSAWARAGAATALAAAPPIRDRASRRPKCLIVTAEPHLSCFPRDSRSRPEGRQQAAIRHGRTAVALLTSVHARALDSFPPPAPGRGRGQGRCDGGRHRAILCRCHRRGWHVVSQDL